MLAAALAMAAIEIDRVTKVYGNGFVAVDDVSLEVARRRVHGARRPVRLRQVDAAADDRRARGGDRRRDPIGGADVTELAPRHRDIAMVFQSYALYPHMTVRENLGYGLKVRRGAEGRGARAASSEVAELLGLDRAARPQARAALRRPAPARRDGPRDRARAAGVPDGRAALEPRREAPRRDARLAGAAPRAARRHDGLRHARPDRGDDARAARRGDARRQDRPGRRAAGALPRAARPLRRRVHRLAGDEPRRGVDRRRRGRASAASAFRSTPAAARPADVDARRARHPARGFEDAAFAPPALPRARASRSRCVEELGAETHVFFRVDAPRVTAETASRRRGRRDACSPSDAHALHRARRPAHAVRAGAGAPTLAVDPARFHFFDPRDRRERSAARRRCADAHRVPA